MEECKGSLHSLNQVSDSGTGSGPRREIVTNAFNNPAESNRLVDFLLPGAELDSLRHFPVMEILPVLDFAPHTLESVSW